MFACIRVTHTLKDNNGTTDVSTYALAKIQCKGSTLVMKGWYF